MRWYISSGINPNTYDENRTSPLHIAARQGSLQIIKELLSSGACINLTDCAGWTPLHVAAYYGRATAVNELLQYGADYALANRRGETPWDLAGNDSTQSIFQKHCQDGDNDFPITKKHVDLSTLELASVLQTMRHEQSTPLIDESSSVVHHLNWGIGSTAINNQLYQNPSPLLVSQCVKLFNSEPLKGFSFFIALGCVAPCAKEVSRFLLANKNLSRQSIGIVLGENSWFHKDIATEVMKSIGFRGLNIIEALRKVIGKCGLPSEGTRITHILQAFSNVYSKENLHFGGPDAIQGLSFSILMIEIEGLSKKEFVVSAKGLLEGKDYPAGVLAWAFEEVTKNPLLVLKETEKLEQFSEFSMQGSVVIHKKNLNIGLCEDVLVFLSQINKSPYAIAILKDCEVSDSWLKGSIAIKSANGIITAKFTKEGKVKVKKETMLIFKSEDWRKWMEAVSKVIETAS